ncbi:DUF2809 domain-containing protein [Flavobacterium sp.]|uniref:DUF2809 domain-containing protein n=1 Tax=Flavobacterium sp. TaxID=239 RepID=UPI0028BECD02|nr:DUF2809 domain-containing protein [Flavobacterium sp.]
MKFEFNVKYAIWTLLLFITEVLIAVCIRDNFIRPYLGDVLVVILLYCFLKSFVKVKTVTAVVCGLCFALLLPH